MRSKSVGVLGGMGPEATAEFFRRIVQKTMVWKEQEHPRIVIESNPKIPDRTEAILHGGENPLPYLMESVQNLENAGVDFIAIPCNTAHYYLEDLRGIVKTPIIDMICGTATRVYEELSPRVVGLLATTGTLKTKLYQRAFAKFDVEVLQPPNDTQEHLMKIIYSEIKTGVTEIQTKGKLVKISDELIDLGAENLIAGCTDVSLVLTSEDLNVPYYDSLDILADMVVERACKLPKDGRGFSIRDIA